MKSICPNLVRFFGIALLVTIALAGCREEEQDRVLFYDKGHYLGKKDQSLSPETLKEIRDRGHRQSMHL